MSRWGRGSVVVAFVAVFVSGGPGCDSAPQEHAGDGDSGVDEGTAVDAGGNGCECPTRADAGLSLPREDVHWSLACGCAVTSCPATIADYDATTPCSEGRTVIRSSGCGLIALEITGYAGRADVFDVASEELRGVYEFSDVAFGECSSAGVFSYSFGDRPPAVSGCADVTSCTLCGQQPSGPPLCDVRP